MSKNQFTVDLGDINLSADQKARINTAIQKAVVSELAGVGTAGNLAFIPVGGGHGGFPPGHGPILQGLIARPLKDQWVKDIANDLK